jgi:hypothetical protein
VLGSCVVGYLLLSQDEQASPSVQTHTPSIRVVSWDHGSIITRQAFCMPIGHRYRPSACRNGEYRIVRLNLPFA